MKGQRFSFARFMNKIRHAPSALAAAILAGKVDDVPKFEEPAHACGRNFRTRGAFGNHHRGGLRRMSDQDIRNAVACGAKEKVLRQIHGR